MAARIRKNDVVVVISGKDKGRRGVVLSVDPRSDMVLVEGINKVTRHRRANPQNPAQGGRIEREAPIRACKLMPWSDKDGKGVRVRFVEKDGQKARVSTKSGATLSATAPAVSEAAPAKKKGGKKE